MNSRSLTCHRALTLGILFFLCLGFAVPSSAQDEDPYTLDPVNRASASTPIPGGIIVNVGYPLIGTILQDNSDQTKNIEKFVRYDIYGYIDAWQLGYSHQAYGDAFTIMQRSIGRDTYTGWYFLLGSQSGSQASAQFPLGIDFGRTIYGFGTQTTGGHSSELSFTYNFDVLIGVAIGDDIMRNDTVLGEVGSNLLLKTGGSVGARVPFGISGISLTAFGDILFYPDPNDINGGGLMQLEIGVKMIGAFNWNL